MPTPPLAPLTLADLRSRMDFLHHLDRHGLLYRCERHELSCLEQCRWLIPPGDRRPRVHAPLLPSKERS